MCIWVDDDGMGKGISPRVMIGFGALLGCVAWDRTKSLPSMDWWYLKIVG
jgi:hypothetical protein